jgi:hypothetical protein
VVFASSAGYALMRLRACHIFRVPERCSLVRAVFWPGVNSSDTNTGTPLIGVSEISEMKLLLDGLFVIRYHERYGMGER